MSDSFTRLKSGATVCSFFCCKQPFITAMLYSSYNILKKNVESKTSTFGWRVSYVTKPDITGLFTYASIKSTNTIKSTVLQRLTLQNLFNIKKLHVELAICVLKRVCRAIAMLARLIIVEIVNNCTSKIAFSDGVLIYFIHIQCLL
ncbi:Hypothetical_protein [Hexamita inflata]|uniref:Hypothetical_protein n=1 Tax=Hexamita inflata TaxID=28002 RepID=A0ABP1I0Y9_9EUKA